MVYGNVFLPENIKADPISFSEFLESCITIDTEFYKIIDESVVVYEGAGDTIRKLVIAAVDKIAEIFRKIIGVIKNVIDKLSEFLNGLYKKFNIKDNFVKFTLKDMKYENLQRAFVDGKFNGLMDDVILFLFGSTAEMEALTTKSKGGYYQSSTSKAKNIKNIVDDEVRFIVPYFIKMLKGQLHLNNLMSLDSIKMIAEYPKVDPEYILITKGLDKIIDDCYNGRANEETEAQIQKLYADFDNEIKKVYSISGIVKGIKGGNGERDSRRYTDAGIDPNMDIESILQFVVMDLLNSIGFNVKSYEDIKNIKDDIDLSFLLAKRQKFDVVKYVTRKGETKYANFTNDDTFGDGKTGDEAVTAFVNKNNKPEEDWSEYDNTWESDDNDDFEYFDDLDESANILYEAEDNSGDGINGMMDKEVEKFAEYININGEDARIVSLKAARQGYNLFPSEEYFNNLIKIVTGGAAAIKDQKMALNKSIRTMNDAIKDAYSLGKRSSRDLDAENEKLASKCLRNAFKLQYQMDMFYSKKCMAVMKVLLFANKIIYKNSFKAYLKYYLAIKKYGMPKNK